MRAIWTGSLSFGLVNIPVRLYSATQDHQLSFHFLHKQDLEPIRFARVCRHDGEEVPHSDIVRGYEYKKGHFVVLTDEDFHKANLRRTQTIDLVAFSSQDEIDSVYYQKPYYLEPDKSAGKAFTLLREALRKAKKVGVAKFVLRNRDHLAVIRPEGNLIVLNQLRFADEVREPKGLKAPATKPVGAELEMALDLIDHLTKHFDPKSFKDKYTSDLEQVIEKKAHGKTVKAKGREPRPTPVKDLVGLLKASLEKERDRTKRKAA